MKDILLLDKPISLTPLQAINKFREGNPEYGDIKMSYAGRLDPMAHGLLLILVGEENKKREKYQDMNKVYEFDILFGVATDTYDIMGISNSIEISREDFDIEKKVKKNISKFEGKFMQKFPPYSSARVDGDPLFKWAREGRIDEIELPEKEVEVKYINYIDRYNIDSEQLLKNIIERVSKVKGDFRQDEIIKKWRKLVSNLGSYTFPVVKLKAEVTSGTYIRSIANNLGKKLKTKSLSYNIYRKRIGSYSISDAVSL